MARLLLSYVYNAIENNGSQYPKKFLYLEILCKKARSHFWEENPLILEKKFL